MIGFWFGERFKQPVEGFVGIALSFVQQGHKLRTDDGPCGVALGGCKRLIIADAKAYHTGIAQVHLVDAAEILLLLLVEALLGSRDSSRADHVDEAVGVLVDEADALRAGLGRDEHDDAQVVAVGNGFHDVLVVVEGQIGMMAPLTPACTQLWQNASMP